MIIVLYVDDLLITGSSQAEIASLKGAMNQAFSMTDLGLLSQFLGLEISQTKSGIKVHQSKYALDLLNKFKMKDCKASKTPFLLGVQLEVVLEIQKIEEELGPSIRMNMLHYLSQIQSL